MQAPGGEEGRKGSRSPLGPGCSPAWPRAKMEPQGCGPAGLQRVGAGLCSLSPESREVGAPLAMPGLASVQHPRR